MRPAIDVSTLPDYALGHRAVTWWGTTGLMCIEGTVFALAIANVLYLRGLTSHWPPAEAPPALMWGTLNSAILVLSAIPNQLTKSAAERGDLRRVKLWLYVSLVFGAGFAAVRFLEFRALNVWWFTDAYGSIVWILLGLHTSHIFTDVLDSAVLAVMLSRAPVQKSMFANISENSLYWYFVIGLWLPVYVLIYLFPRWS